MANDRAAQARRGRRAKNVVKKKTLEATIVPGKPKIDSKADVDAKMLNGTAKIVRQV